MESIGAGDPLEQDAEISKLAERAEKSNDKRDWNEVAVALFNARRFDEAISIFDQLIRLYPDADHIRLSLATAYSQVAQVALCRRHLKYLAEHGSTEESRQTGRQQLDGYEQFIGLTEADIELQKRQIEALREATAFEGCPAEDFLRFARIFWRSAQLEMRAGYLDKSREILEAAVLVHPQDVGVLEHLVNAYLRSDPESRLDETMRRLEKLAPDSQVLKLLAETSREDPSNWGRDMGQRVSHLLQLVMGDDAALREPALADLRHIVEQYPQNPDYRMHYAFALMVSGDREEVARQAYLLYDVDEPSHSLHFNIGQIFYYIGDHVKGRAHLELAARYATNEQERSDAWNLISDIEKT
ncbi:MULTISPECIES: tetratricopeptide repeat protein [unclassified Burkholderia]|uniref:tetratricopeptide repeat protein n=1 Tax=unclassified Burkholderia TaxID=2613784 RepID=UPI001423B4EF|nr:MULTISPECIES: tetratricopeptide repeat protein [unclassified Burkholderia]NIE59626.1 tetratricopeptide repeat protein [Burkholderia sp. Ap-955]NIF11711.1 tetratricopeptide repeat protein [Burkholderia sp. Ax-1735]NIG04558.1 tetratricopeptide repeat protein [Burkholderia sp. Tr-849]